MKQFIYQSIIDQISLFTRFYDRLVQVNRLDWDDGLLFNGIHNDLKINTTIDQYAVLNSSSREAILLHGNLNNSLDIQSELAAIEKKMNRSSRVIAVLWNPYLAWLYRLVTWLGLRDGPLPTCFVTKDDLNNLCKLSNFEIVQQGYCTVLPFKLFGLGKLINKILVNTPIIRNLSLIYLAILRPVKKSVDPSLTVIIPARNEAGNIENALKRIPLMCSDIEVIFVEGNSEDGTMEEIKRVASLNQYTDKFSIKYFNQPGKGKFDAVKIGFEKATKDLLVILDADLTMPPEKLPQFYNAYVEGKGDFINGSRQVYPMEGEAMKFLNMLGNKFFAKTLSYLIDTRITDSLCGTKLFSRYDYQLMKEWRAWFGDFDPFGDFEMIFSASELKLGLIDVPVHYKARTYGETQIRRFRDGFLLLRMTLVAFMKIKLSKH